MDQIAFVQWLLYFKNIWGNLHGVIAKVLDYSLEVLEFKLSLCNYVHFQTNILGMNLSYSPSYESNSNTAVFLQGMVLV